MKCVRCNNLFQNNYHTMAHSFSICESCRNESPKNINDQTKGSNKDPYIIELKDYLEFWSKNNNVKKNI